LVGVRAYKGGREGVANKGKGKSNMTLTKWFAVLFISLCSAYTNVGILIVSAEGGTFCEVLLFSKMTSRHQMSAEGLRVNSDSDSYLTDEEKVNIWWQQCSR